MARKAQSVEEPVFGMEDQTVETEMAEEKELKAEAPEAEAQEAETVKDPWKDMKKIFLPKTIGQDNYLIASVNGHVYKVKRGEWVDVPAPIWEVIDNAMTEEQKRDAYIEAKLQEMNDKERSLFG